MIPEQYKNILEKLRKKTIKDVIRWEQGASSPTEFFVHFKKGSINIDKHKENDGGELIYITVINENHEEVDKFAVKPDMADFHYVATFYEIIIRKFYSIEVHDSEEGIEDMLDSIEEELDSID
ncbi:MAG: hypothetical protein GY754_08915 [bacterium]|nr:hypothetical protein [bacterium]